MLFFLQKPPTNTQNVYMKYISYLKILNIAAYSGGYPFSISGDIRSVPS